MDTDEGGVQTSINSLPTSQDTLNSLENMPSTLSTSQGHPQPHPHPQHDYHNFDEKQLELEAAMKLKRTDAILEMDIFDCLKNFIQLGGTPHQVIQHLNESYRGYSEMCKLLAYWLSVVGISNQEILEVVEEHIKKMIINEFDVAKVDKILESDSRPVWLIEMIQEDKWRHLIYQLSELNRDCLLLNFGIQHISLAGYDDEIASLPSAATYFNVYNRVLFNTIRKAITLERNERLQLLHIFSKLCGHAEHIYIYTHALLHSMFNEEHGEKLKCISQELDLTKNAYQHPFHSSHLEQDEFDSELVQIVQKIMFQMTDIYQYPNIQNSIHAILSSEVPSPADVRRLYMAYTDPRSAVQTRNTYDYHGGDHNIEDEHVKNSIGVGVHHDHLLSSSDDRSFVVSKSSPKPILESDFGNMEPPPVEYIRRSDLIQKLIVELFDPGRHVPPEFLECYCWILSYTTCSDDMRTVITTKTEGEKHHEMPYHYSSSTLKIVQAVTQALCTVHTICQQNYFGFELAGAPVDHILEHIHYPVVGLGVLHWISANFSDSDRLSTSWNTKSLSTHLAIWREIVLLHPLYHTQAFNILVSGFETDPCLGSLDALNLKKMILESLQYMLECDYVIPVIHQVQNWATNMDSSLTRHFIIGTLEIIGPPYSKAFIQPFTRLIVNTRIDPREHHDILIPFINDLLSTEEYDLQLELIQALEKMKKELIL